jgi:hypothetical protein
LDECSRLKAAKFLAAISLDDCLAAPNQSVCAVSWIKEELVLIALSEALAKLAAWATAIVVSASFDVAVCCSVEASLAPAMLAGHLFQGHSFFRVRTALMAEVSAFARADVSWTASLAAAVAAPAGRVLLRTAPRCAGIAESGAFATDCQRLSILVRTDLSISV